MHLFLLFHLYCLHGKVQQLLIRSKGHFGLIQPIIVIIIIYYNYITCIIQFSMIMHTGVKQDNKGEKKQSYICT